MIKGHWTDAHIAQFIQFCKTQGAQAMNPRRYMNGDVEFDVNCPPTTNPQKLMQQFEKENT